jgi:hypothetical protein
LVGTGRLSGNLALAHAQSAISRILLSGAGTGKKPAPSPIILSHRALPARAAGDLEKEARAADLITCCTLSCTPLIKGAWLKPGTHLDLVGAFTPLMAETDDEALQRATLFVDTRSGACQEAGEIVQAIRRGAIKPDDIQASLFELVSKAHPGRTSTTQITVFKSVGCALEDLAAAELCVETPTDPLPMPPQPPERPSALNASAAWGIPLFYAVAVFGAHDGDRGHSNPGLRHFDNASLVSGIYFIASLAGLLASLLLPAVLKPSAHGRLTLVASAMGVLSALLFQRSDSLSILAGLSAYLLMVQLF